MTHIHWVTRQNKLEIPIDKDEVNKREIRECNGRAHDPDTMVAPLTPKPTRKAEALALVCFFIIYFINKAKEKKIVYFVYRRGR
jgi:hypothetical protein